ARARAREELREARREPDLVADSLLAHHDDALAGEILAAPHRSRRRSLLEPRFVLGPSAREVAGAQEPARALQPALEVLLRAHPCSASLARSSAFAVARARRAAATRRSRVRERAAPCSPEERRFAIDGAIEIGFVSTSSLEGSLRTDAHTAALASATDHRDSA